MAEDMNAYIAGQNSMMRGNDCGAMGCNGGWFIWIILILAIFSGGFGGWGGNASAQGALTRAEMYEGFNTAEIQRNQNDLMRGQFDIQKDVLQNRFDAAQCCCNTQKEILESRYTTQLGFQNLQAMLQQCCCDMKTATHAEAEATRNLFVNTEIQNLRDKLADRDRDILTANFQLSQQAQSANIIGTLRPFPQPAYITCSPYQAATTVYGCNTGCCC